MPAGVTAQDAGKDTVARPREGGEMPAGATAQEVGEDTPAGTAVRNATLKPAAHSLLTDMVKDAAKAAKVAGRNSEQNPKPAKSAEAAGAKKKAGKPKPK